MRMTNSVKRSTLELPRKLTIVAGAGGVKHKAHPPKGLQPA